jgi:hypothetical protein
MSLVATTCVGLSPLVVFTDDSIGFDGRQCLLCSALQDTSFLYVGRLLEGFGVGVISYVVSTVIKLHALPGYILCVP